jgi:ATP-binding cassette subfamily F protein uup
MALLLNCRSITKLFGAQVLFRGVSLAIEEGERHGLIGPNGSGKTTLLSILAGAAEADSGEVAWRKNLRTAAVAQEPSFDPALTVGEIVRAAARDVEKVNPLLGQAGFFDADVRAGALSGGWRKRLALVRALAEEPELLLLDEPTNHLDLEGILWLERTLEAAPFACLVVSHDRYFLENVADHMAELNPTYPDGIFRVEGNYSEFLEKREQWFEAREKQREALAAVVRREVEWLRRGAKARTRKSKARIDTANEMIGALADIEERRKTAIAQIDFSATDRKTKRLATVRGLGHAAGGRELFRGVSFVLAPGTCLGVAGANGSGKTTLLKLLLGGTAVQEGSVERAELLQTVYFDQGREQLDLSQTLKRALAAEGDAVIYRGKSIHVNAWAKRFLFRLEQLEQPLASLSGGERARVLIARLMLKPADLLLLDEPTNDLDIPTLAVLEESLLEFPGALVLVTHDRYLLDRVSTQILGLDGEGGAIIYADYAQWEAGLRERRGARGEAPRQAPPAEDRPAEAAPAPAAKKKLSYLDQREWDAIEERILEAEARLEAAQARLQAADVVVDARKMEDAYRESTAAQEAVDALYARWAELESKLS